MKPFTDKRRILWLVGGAALLIGILAWGFIGPTTEKVPGMDGPQVDVPGMTNIPAKSGPKLNLEAEH